MAKVDLFLFTPGLIKYHCCRVSAVYTSPFDLPKEFYYKNLVKGVPHLK